MRLSVRKLVLGGTDRQVPTQWRGPTRPDQTRRDETRPDETCFVEPLHLAQDARQKTRNKHAPLTRRNISTAQPSRLGRGGEAPNCKVDS